MAVRVRYLTDPACPRSWAHEPAVRRLRAEFGAELRWTFVMGGLAREFGADGGSGASRDGWAEGARLLAHWLEVAAGAGMPCDPLLWREAPLRSSYPACLAVKAAAEQASDGGAAYLRAVREGLFCFRRRLDTPDALVEEGRRAGLDAERFRLDLGSNAILEAFGADLDAVREVPDEARAEGAVEAAGEHERLPFPTLLFAGEGGERAAVYGDRPYEDLRTAALDAGARPADGPAPDPLTALRRLGPMATPEVAAVCDLPGPPAAAELWRLAASWKVTRTPVLTGELWQVT